MAASKLATLAPSLLFLAAGACAVPDDFGDPPTRDGTREGLALFQIEEAAAYLGGYVAEGEEVLFAIRRTVTEVVDPGDAWVVRYLEAAAAATDYEVEVVLTDDSSGIRLKVRGVDVSLDRGGSTDHALESALARFGDAILALDAADPPIPPAERRMIRNLAEGTAPLGLDLITPSIESADSPCEAVIDLAHHGESVTSDSHVTCSRGGEYAFRTCIESYPRDASAWLKSLRAGGGFCIAGGLLGGVLGIPLGSVGPAAVGCAVFGGLGARSSLDETYGTPTSTTCRSHARDRYEDPPMNGQLEIVMHRIDIFCGDEGAKNHFKAHVEETEAGVMIGSEKMTVKCGQ